MYDGYLNRYSFIKDGRKTTFVPLSSDDVFSDQLKLRNKKKEFEGEELKEKQELSEKLKKKKSEKNNEKEMKLKKKKKFILYLCTRKDI